MIGKTEAPCLTTKDFLACPMGVYRLVDSYKYIKTPETFETFETL